MSHRLSESEHQDAPARVLLLIDFVDFQKRHLSGGQGLTNADGRGTENHVAVALLMGHWQDLRIFRGQETNPTSGVLRQELLAGGL